MSGIDDREVYALLRETPTETEELRTEERKTALRELLLW
jgi:hypothetical protein